MVFRRILNFFYIGLFTIPTPFTFGAHAENASPSSVPIRIGWQIPAATQGQVLQVLKRTNVLESHGLKPVFVPFSYVGPQVDAAFSGELDVFFSGDQPAINLIARGGNRRIHTANLALAVTFALVMVLAFDLDRAGEGLVAVNQQPMIDLYKNMLQ